MRYVLMRKRLKNNLLAPDPMMEISERRQVGDAEAMVNPPEPLPRGKKERGDGEGLGEGGLKSSGVAAAAAVGAVAGHYFAGSRGGESEV